MTFRRNRDGQGHARLIRAASVRAGLLPTTSRRADALLAMSRAHRVEQTALVAPFLARQAPRAPCESGPWADTAMLQFIAGMKDCMSLGE
jgi:hypothetical protein